jgi:hypothetical protein
MGHSDWLTADLAKHERDQDEQADFDAALISKTEEIEREFIRECSYGSPEECAFLEDAVAGLTGDRFALMLGDFAANGKLLRQFIDGVINQHAHDKAVVQMQKRDSTNRI